MIGRELSPDLVAGRDVRMAVRVPAGSVRPDTIVTYCIVSRLGLPRWAADSTVTDRVGRRPSLF